MLLTKPTGRMCRHADLRPTDWNQSKPAAAEMMSCQCGQCYRCPVCSAGGMAFPCACVSKALDRITKPRVGSGEDCGAAPVPLV